MGDGWGLDKPVPPFSPAAAPTGASARYVRPVPLRGFYTDRVLPRITDLALGKPMDETRARVASGLSGEVLEIGFGSGRNLRHLPPTVTRLLAVEPASGGPKLAKTRIAAAACPVELIGLDGQSIPLADAAVDHVLITWTLCTIPDAGAALREAIRVLRPGGTLHFVEHGRSPDPKVARRQDQLNPVWRKVFGGCNLNRSASELLQAAGFQLDELRTYQTPGPGPKAPGFMYEGVASKPLAPAAS